mgnify:CR=1 FL=1
MGKGRRWYQLRDGNRRIGVTELKDSLDAKIKKIVERSSKDPHCEFTWLMPWFSVDNLKECFKELDGNKGSWSRWKE